MIGQGIAIQALALLQQAPSVASGPMSQEQFRQQITLQALRHHHSGAGVLVPILVPLGFFALVIAIVWLAIRHKQAKMRARAEFNKQLLDKFSSGQEFAAFLDSKGSQRFLDELWSRNAGAKDQMLHSMKVGVIFSAVGLGLFSAMFMDKGFFIPAVIFFSIGVGYLIVSFISHRLSLQWARSRDADAANS